jgi:multidrug efflux system membrane fusion protein
MNMQTDLTSPSLSVADESRPRRRSWTVVILLLVGVAVVGVLVWRARSVSSDRVGAGAGADRAAGPRAGAGAEARPVTVIAAPVARKDVPVYLDGLGSVTAFKTVTVRPRVDGQLQSVGFKEGQAVKRGDVLAIIDPRPFQIQLHQAQATLARDTAQLKGARLNLERYVSVRKDKLIAEQQVDDQRTVVEQMEAAVKGDEAQVENAKLTLEYARITSPIDGVTGVRLIDQGNLVHANDPNGLVMVTQLDPIAVMFTLPQDELQSVAYQMSQGKLSVTALSRDGQTELGTGIVELIDNQINAATSTIRMKAIFPNPKQALWPNQFVKARLLLTTKKGALVVPAVAIQRGPRGTFVYVVGPDQKASLRNVEVDTLEADMALIARGVQEGEQVVIDGQSQLKPGALVQIKGAEGPGGGGKGRGPREARTEGGARETKIEGGGEPKAEGGAREARQGRAP